MPATTPEAEPIVATAVLLLLHVPPADRLSNVDEVPIHIPSEPVIADGEDPMLTVTALPQPPALV
jgi:hypothetical protein